MIKPVGFDLQDEYCRVSSSLSIRRNPESSQSSGPLFLHGSMELDLQQVQVDNQIVTEKDYRRTDEGLLISQVPDSCVIRIEVLIKPI